MISSQHHLKNQRITKHLNFRISEQKVEQCTKVFGDKTLRTSRIEYTHQ